MPTINTPGISYLFAANYLLFIILFHDRNSAQLETAKAIAVINTMLPKM